VLIRGGDPVITIDVAGAKLKAPLSHQLPHHRRSHARYAMNVATIARLVAKCVTDAATVDVGASVGDTAAIARSAAPELPILCVEGNPRFAKLLRENLEDWSHVSCEAPSVLAEVARTIAGELESADGTARVRIDDVSGVRVSTLDRVLESYPRSSSPALIKSDTDGFEARVLAGAGRTVERARRVLFLEYHPVLLSAAGSDGLALLAWLRERGYGPAVVYDNFGGVLCSADVRSLRFFEDLHRYALRRPLFYFDLALFATERAADAEELYARDATPQRGP
jgi:FkbM family methyltransferase